MTDKANLDDHDPWQGVATDAERDYFARVRTRRILPAEILACMAAAILILASVFDTAGAGTIDRITTSSTIIHCQDDGHRSPDC